MKKMKKAFEDKVKEIEYEEIKFKEEENRREKYFLMLIIKPYIKQLCMISDYKRIWRL
ncbi:hypothetical protein OGZ02_13405 [Brachyspira hyodysenteriae]|nr:hypothetical protein [Brachyspira hyodysenteriae]MDA1469805.1 hypothetical protein [Brachyspira hyodysenteriae]